MALVVPQVCRYAVEGSYGDRPCVNILDFEIDTTGSTFSREEEIYETAGNIINAWSEHIVNIVVAQYTAEQVSWVDLNSASGTTGSRSSTSEQTWPLNGKGGSSSSVSNTAVLITKETQSARGQRDGRMYIAGISEVDTGTYDIGETQLTAWQAMADALLTELNDESSAQNLRTLAVVHTTGANPTVGTHTLVTDLQVDQRLATQRRRLRG